MLDAATTVWKDWSNVVDKKKFGGNCSASAAGGRAGNAFVLDRLRLTIQSLRLLQAAVKPVITLLNPTAGLQA
jgi:hypothetical protein